jgi:hypothetical protein
LGLATLIKFTAAAALSAAAAGTGWRWLVARQSKPVEAAAATVSSPVEVVRAIEVAPAAVLPSAAPPREPQSPPGTYQPPPVIVDGAPRVYALTRNVWVRPRASAKDSWIGFLWFGASVPVRAPTPVAGPGCAGSWYAIEPRGYVCVDDERATLDPDHPSVRGLSAYAPNLGSAWPHRYGESIDLERYRVLPTTRVQRAREWYYRGHRALVARARAGETFAALLGIDLSDAPETPLILPEIPRTLPMESERLEARSTVAWTREQLHEGRSFLLSSDLKWVPKDRVKAYPPITFRGVHLGTEGRLPLAFFRGRDRPSYRRGEDGCFEIAGPTFARLSWVQLSGKREICRDRTYLETGEPGRFVLEEDAVVPRPATETPWGTPLDAAVDPKAPTRGRQTWIEASILGGWLIAYEGRNPVFTTLLAAGRGGPPQGDIEPIETASTPVGRFKITGKFATATMVAPNDLTHSEVPWAQNFSGPHALHAAYWHDGWGELKSGGCVNVSPIDGRWLYSEFTEPRVPEGWHGVRWLSEIEPATTLIIRRK